MCIYIIESNPGFIDYFTHRVLCCRFAPNGWVLATGSANGQFLLFDAYTGTCVAKKRIGAAHDGSVTAIAVMPPLQDAPMVNGLAPTETDKCHFATAGDDCVVRIWRVECSTNGSSEFQGGVGRLP